ncbi:MAG TPA: di-heme oxidoredictase family protein [Gemmatimonadaceae bacterium]|nr:di-heme oxidoredictase family protein [Gemmatimonadaceae bacterium]
MNRRPSFVALALAASALVLACDALTTEAPAEGEVFDAPLPGLTTAELAAFARGDAEFGRRFAPSEGLGPIFNNVSCLSCHSGDGRGRLDNALQRIGSADDAFLNALGGPQIQDKAIPGAEFERAPAGIPVSTRLPPPVFGVGLMEAIPDSVILKYADADDADGDGVSGRPNYVTPHAYVPSGPADPVTRLGRFGRKAQVSTLLEQVAEAYHQDIGITSDFIMVENRNPLSSVATEAADRVGDPEIPAATVQAVVNYLRLLAPSHPGPETEGVRQGRAGFHQVGCASCHVPTLRTGQSTVTGLSNQPVDLYSDLLLHDMGDELADQRPDGGASGREWKTTPLWGLRLMRRFLNGDAFLMHDGRARSVEEAILVHAGEAKRARDAFAALTPPQRAAIIEFVESR